MAENQKNRPISWAITNTSYVVEEVKKREQSQDVSRRLTSSVDHKDRNSSEWEITYDAMEEEFNGI
jgi:hypothetical protein